jgi:hypothetical protein
MLKRPPSVLDIAAVGESSADAFCGATVTDSSRDELSCLLRANARLGLVAGRNLPEVGLLEALPEGTFSRITFVSKRLGVTESRACFVELLQEEQTLTFLFEYYI